MKRFQFIFVGFFLIGFSFFANAETVDVFKEDLEMDYLVEELTKSNPNSAEFEENCASGKAGSSKFEIDLSDLLNELETHSKDSCRYFFENSSPILEEVPLKKEGFDVITN
jgi:hypothetical protein